MCYVSTRKGLNPDKHLCFLRNINVNGKRNVISNEKTTRPWKFSESGAHPTYASKIAMELRELILTLYNT